jgi:hypothetical protein
MVFNSKHKPVVELFGLPDPPKTGRARLVHAAIELFYSHGFQTVGVDQIIAAAGAEIGPVPYPGGRALSLQRRLSPRRRSDGKRRAQRRNGRPGGLKRSVGKP